MLTASSHHLQTPSWSSLSLHKLDNQQAQDPVVDSRVVSRSDNCSSMHCFEEILAETQFDDNIAAEEPAGMFVAVVRG